MQNKKNNLHVIIRYSVLFLIIYVVFGNIFHTNSILPEEDETYRYVSPMENKEIISQKKHGIPTNIQIPKINIDIEIEKIGITSQGILDIPKNFSHAGWFQGGPRPGEKGVAIIDGHFGFIKGIPGPFNHLHTLQKGDSIHIKDELGNMQTFIVSQLKTYKQSDDTYEVFHSDDEKSHLNIITCQGVWDENKKSYPYRLVVFTQKQEK